ncbi:MAG: hypothetical protein KA230_10585 [Flavobacteriales bacterium]|nr:hypothetical protein [Flavobacteriales bacterium]
MSGNDRKLYFFLALVAFCYVLARAVLVPFVHDEAATVSMYVQFGEFLPWRSHWDAGNHFLNTALGIVGYKLFGLEQLAIRAANVLAFVLYAWMVWRLGGYVRDRLVCWCMWLALLLCPFLLEFFSLFRGYGLEMVFFVWALHALLSFARYGRVGQFVQVLLALCLANASILALLPFWAIVLGLLAIMIGAGKQTRVVRARLSLAWVVFGVLPLLLAARIAMEMQEIGLLYHGNTQGFVAVTVSTLSWFVLGSQHPVLIGSLIIGFSSMTAVAAGIIRRERSFRHPLVIIIGLLWAEVLARVVMATMLHVNYPEDRAALHLVPLFVLAAALCIDELGIRIPGWRYAAFVLLFLPVRSLALANLDHTVLWPDQSPPQRFVDRLIALQAAQERPLAIGAYHLMNRSLPFAVRAREEQLPLPLTEGFPEGPHDVRIVRDDHLQQALKGFREVDHHDGTGLHLLERNQPLVLSPVLVNAFSCGATSDEFVEVLRLDSLSAEDEFLVEVTGEMSTINASAVKLVLELRDASDKSIHYDAAMITAFAPLFGRVREVRHIPALVEARSAVVYFWNVRRTALTLTNGAVRLNLVE